MPFSTGQHIFFSTAKLNTRTQIFIKIKKSKLTSRSIFVLGLNCASEQNHFQYPTDGLSLGKKNSIGNRGARPTPFRPTISVGNGFRDPPNRLELRPVGDLTLFTTSELNRFFFGAHLFLWFYDAISVPPLWIWTKGVVTNSFGRLKFLYWPEGGQSNNRQVQWSPPSLKGFFSLWNKPLLGHRVLWL